MSLNLSANGSISETTLKRHGYYCRSRGTGATPRSRSCVACAKGKGRCDNRRPQCSRCTLKGHECSYPAPFSKSTGSKALSNDHAITGNNASDNDMVLDNGVLRTGPNFTDTHVDEVDWDSIDLNFLDVMNLPTNEEVMSYFPVMSPWKDVHPLPFSNPLSTLATSTPPEPTNAVRSFIQRPRPETGARRIASLTLSTLKSYAVTMLRDGSLPSFIHPYFTTIHTKTEDMEPLNNCICLVHMIRSGLQGSRKLFWRNVRLECERLRDKVCLKNTLDDIRKEGLIDGISIRK